MVRSWYKHSRFPEENAKRFTVPNAFVAAEDSTDYTSTMGTKTVLSSIYQSPPLLSSNVWSGLMIIISGQVSEALHLYVLELGYQKNIFNPT